MEPNRFLSLWVSLLMATLAMLCPQIICAAGATSTEINNAIVQEGSIPLTWENDSQHPWILEPNKIKSSNTKTSTTTNLSFSYESVYPTTIRFKTEKTQSDYNFSILVDGTVKYSTSDCYSRYEASWSFRLPKGNHTITFRYKNENTNATVSIWDVSVNEYPGASMDEINTAIVDSESVPLTWILDEDYPWRLTDSKLNSGNFGFVNTSDISFKYSSIYPTTIRFKTEKTQSDYNFSILVDGAVKYSTSDCYSRYEASWSFRLPKGNHTITFRYKNENTNATVSIWDVSVAEPRCASSAELNSKFVLSSIKPTSWENDSIYPLGYYNDILQTSNAFWENSKSNLKAHVNFEKPSVISFDWRVGYDDYQGNHIAKFYVDGILKYSNSRNTSWATNTVALSAGEHTLHWEYSSTSTGANYWMQLKDLSISSDWVSVESSPGMLGVETLYKVNKLQDVNFLKIKGGMNDADWQVVKQMVNLYGLDLSEAEITTFPASFNSNANFGYIVLPETLKQIPDKAFTTCNIHSITIPSSVTKIGNEAFASTNLGFIDFADNSQLTTIGYKAFYSTKIKEFTMPNSVTEMCSYSDGSKTQLGYTFANCYDLNTISFSNALTYIPRYACYNCKSISEIHFPDNLIELDAQFMYMENVVNNCLETVEFPNSLKIIWNTSFYDVRKLTNVTLSSNLTHIYPYAFYNTSIKSIEFPSTLTYLGSYAFQKCKFESVILPSKLSTIGEYAFADNHALKNVLLPSGITNYDNQFSGCENIQSIECLCATPPAITNDPFGACVKSNVTLKVPQFAVATYKLDPYWYQFDPIIEGEPTDYWKIIGDLKLLNNRRMEGKPDVDLYYGGKLTVKGDAAMPIGKFDIYTSEGNPSSFVTDCTNITADEINTIFSVSANKWHFLTPMVDVDLQQVIVSGTTNYVFRYYDGAARADIGAGTSWKNVSDMKLKAGVGYIFQCDAAGTLTFPVPVSLHKNILTTGAVTLPLTPHPSDNKANKGWNYVGNPFPSYFDIHYMDFTAPITVWNGSTYKAYSITDDDFVLRPMQGFFVQKPDAVDNIVLQAAGRQIESTVNRPNHVAPLSRASSEKERFIFNIEIASDTLSDATRIVLNEKASTEYELERDASKFMSMNEYVPQIYSIDNEGNRLAINERPATNGEIALGVYIPDGNVNYSISASRIEGEAYLYDTEMRITHNLADGDYSFSAEKGTNNNRFSIILKSNVSSSIDTVADGNIVKISTVENGIEICGASDKAIRVVTLEGIIIYSAKQSEGTINIPLPSGIYIVNVENQSYKVIVK